jgi:hypothetical protein
MASAKFIRALAEGNVVIKKAPLISGQVQLTFRPTLDKRTGKTTQPAPILLSGWEQVEPLKRSDVTLDHLRNSNLEDLVRCQAIVLL